MRIRFGLATAVVALVCAALAFEPIANAKSGKGKRTGVSQSYSSKSTPPGWSKGKKTGWGGEKYPPGWSKWDDKKKAKWIGDRDEAIADVDSVCIRYRIEERKRNQITEAFNEAIAGGLIINEARKKLVAALKDEDERRALMIDTTKSVLDLLK